MAHPGSTTATGLLRRWWAENVGRSAPKAEPQIVYDSTGRMRLAIPWPARIVTVNGVDHYHYRAYYRPPAFRTARRSAAALLSFTALALVGYSASIYAHDGSDAGLGAQLFLICLALGGALAIGVYGNI